MDLLDNVSTRRAGIFSLKSEEKKLRKEIIGMIRDLRAECPHKNIREAQWSWWDRLLWPPYRREEKKTVRICMNCGLSEEHKFEGEYFLTLTVEPEAKTTEAEYARFRAMEIPIFVSAAE